MHLSSSQTHAIPVEVRPFRAGATDDLLRLSVGSKIVGYVERFTRQLWRDKYGSYNFETALIGLVAAYLPLEAGGKTVKFPASLDYSCKF